jgi:hypothetical protein
MATIDGTSRKTFSANVKKVVAQTDILYHPKFQDATKMPWQGRVIVTCNTDEESLSIVPTTDNSITDKLMLFKLGAWYPEFPPNHIIEAQVKAELPFFLRWLESWNPPKSIMAGAGRSRYGVNSFHHPKILAHSQSLSAATHLREDLDAMRHMKDSPMFQDKATVWEGSSGDLMRLGREFFATKCSAVQLGVWLAQIYKSNVAPWLGRREERSKKTVWTIAKP